MIDPDSPDEKRLRFHCIEPLTEKDARMGLDLMARLYDVLDQLGVTGYNADLRAGKIYWRNAEDRIVASANLFVILSWAWTNRSILWAYALPYFIQAGVPVVEPTGEMESYFEDVDDDVAALMAVAAAQKVGAEFVYHADGLYLAIFDFAVGDVTLGPEVMKKREAAAIEYVALRLSHFAAWIREPERHAELRSIMEAFVEELGRQTRHSIQGSPLAEKVDALAGRVTGWIPLVDADAAALSALIDVERADWR